MTNRQSSWRVSVGWWWGQVSDPHVNTPQGEWECLSPPSPFSPGLLSLNRGAGRMAGDPVWGPLITFMIFLCHHLHGSDQKFSWFTSYSPSKYSKTKEVGCILFLFFQSHVYVLYTYYNNYSNWEITRYWSWTYHQSAHVVNCCTTGKC